MGIIAIILGLFIWGLIFAALERGYHRAKTLGKDAMQLIDEAGLKGKKSKRLKMAVCFVRLVSMISTTGMDKNDFNRRRELKIGVIYNFLIKDGADDELIAYIKRIIKESENNNQYGKTISIINNIAQEEDKIGMVYALLGLGADESEMLIILAILRDMGFNEQQREHILQTFLGDDELDLGKRLLQSLHKLLHNLSSVAGDRKSLWWKL